jgi:hypothetical protein
LWLGYANATSVSGEPPGSQMVQAGGEAGIGRLSISGSLARSTTAWHVTIPGSTIYAADTIVPPVIPDVEETRRAAGGALRLGGTWSATRWNVATTGGLRWDKSLPAARWLHLEGAWWVAPRLALRLGLGREAADLWQVRPARLGNSLALEWTRPHWQAPASPASTPREVTLRVVSVTGDLRQIEISAPGAHRIEAMGDFTMWEAVELRRWSAGRFRMERHMEPGIYRVLVRRDGGPWMIPANLPGTDDPDLGAAGSLVIE